MPTIKPSKITEITAGDLTDAEKLKIIDLFGKADTIETFCAGVNYALGTMQKVLQRQQPALLKKAIDESNSSYAGNTNHANHAIQETPEFAAVCTGVKPSGKNS